MIGHRVAVALCAAAIVVAACSGSGGATGSTGDTGGSSSAATANPVASPPATQPSPSSDQPSPTSSAPEATDTEGPTAEATDIDPCTLVTSAEVSTLTGATFGPGEESTTEGNAKLCSYSQEGIEFEVLLAVAPDATTAAAGESTFLALVQQGVQEAGIAHPTLTLLPGFTTAGDAAVLSGSSPTQVGQVSGIALYGLKNADFLALSCLGSLGASIPTIDAMEAQGLTSFGRLP